MNDLPKDLKPVLAYIETVADLGTSHHYEVVYHDGEQWCHFARSDTFTGENIGAVLRWRYVEDCFSD